MRVGVFTNAYKPIISGVVNCIDLIRQSLIKKGHEVIIFAPRFPGYQEEDSPVYRYRSLNLTKKMKFPVPIPFSRRISALIPTFGLDIIHSHHPFVMGDEGARWAARLGVPLVFTFHTQYEQYAHYIPLPAALVRAVSRMRVKAYAKKCSVIITPGTSIVELLHEYGIRDNVIYMPNAIDLSSFENPDGSRVRARHQIGEKERLLVYVGRMALEKNLPFMLDAFKLIAGTIQVRLMIIGEGPELESLRRYAAALNLGDKVIFPGRVEYREIPAYYGAADLFVMTSTTEVKPLALIEAMASGLPVVAVSAHGSSDTIQDGKNGLLTAEDRGVFAEAVETLLRDGKRLAMMKKESIETAKGYSIDQVTDRLLGLYTDAIEREKNRRGDSPLSTCR
ncbi:MAG: glycosyltransferase family 4 protein [Candidatus Eremiobacteraeota bacterium]|nr:glycosyltransferase family 4 protein [Candidatus Eremiobacteraeota bacterium]